MIERTATLVAGVGETPITPPVGSPLVIRPSTGVHDDLFARVIIICDGTKSLAIISLDLTGMDFALADRLRGSIQDQTGIDLVLVNFTHTHSAPFTIPYGVVNWNWCLNEGNTWREAMLTNITEMVCRANASLSPVVARVGRQAVQIGCNRELDLHERPDHKKPDPSEGTVPWVDVLRLDGMDGQPMAILFSHAAHPVIVHHASDEISAEYPGYAIATIKDRLGPATLAVFAQGCGGDINGEPLNSGFEGAAAAGARLGEAAVQAAKESEPVGTPKLTTASITFDIPLADSPDEQECRRYLAEVEARMAGPDAATMDKVEAWWAADAALCLRDRLEKIARGEKPSLRFDAHAVTLSGEWCLITMPHEMFSEYQRWLEGVSPFSYTMVLAYTNACESYIPTDHDFEIGGPATAPFGAPLWYHHRAAPEIGVEELIKNKLTTLLSSL